MDKQTLKTKLKQQAKQIAWRAITTVILTLTAIVTVWVYASFIEPSVGPNSSDQDFSQNILGANDANNDFTSASVVANKDGSIIERLEYIGKNSGLSFNGQCDSGMTGSTVTVVSASLAGYGDDYFNNKYWMQIVKNANSVGNAPEKEWRLITDYVSSTGTFTVSAFSANAEANDEFIVVHESIAKSKDTNSFYGKCNSNMSGSTTSIVVGELGGFGDDYFNNKYWMQITKNANSIANAPEIQYRLITDYVSSTGTFTVNAFSANVEANDEVLVLHESYPFLKYQEYTTGSGSWTVPKGLLFADVLFCGGGGSGGSTYNTAGIDRSSGGGGGGEYVKITNYPLSGKTTVAYSIGAGAAYNTSCGNNGTAGTASTFDGMSAAGGGFGYSGNDGTYYGKGGTGGGSGGGTAGTWTGGSGGSGTTSGTRIGGGGGGAGNSSGGSGGTGGSSNMGGGAGGAGSSYAGGGGGGGGYLTGGAGGGQTSNGISAAANSCAGGGGSGTYYASSFSCYYGGAGGSGYVLIMWR